MFVIDFTASALDDLRFFKAYEQRIILEAVTANLLYEPLTATQQRKPLRPNSTSSWELRIGRVRVFYDVLEDEHIVRVKAVGWKERNLLFIRGKEYRLEDD